MLPWEVTGSLTEFVLKPQRRVVWSSVESLHAPLTTHESESSQRYHFQEESSSNTGGSSWARVVNFSSVDLLCAWKNLFSVVLCVSALLMYVMAVDRVCCWYKTSWSVRVRCGLGCLVDRAVLAWIRSSSVGLFFFLAVMPWLSSHAIMAEQQTFQIVSLHSSVNCFMAWHSCLSVFLVRAVSWWALSCLELCVGWYSTTSWSCLHTWLVQAVLGLVLF